MLSRARRQAETGAAAPPPKPEPVFKMFCDEGALTHDGQLIVNGWAVCDAGIAQIRVLLDDSLIGLAPLGHERADGGGAYKDIPSAHLSGFRFQTALPGRFEGEHRLRVAARNNRNEEQ